jgi:hypothetical protein
MPTPGAMSVAGGYVGMSEMSSCGERRTLMTKRNKDQVMNLTPQEVADLGNEILHLGQRINRLATRVKNLEAVVRDQDSILTDTLFQLEALRQRIGPPLPSPQTTLDSEAPASLTSS